MKRMSRLKAMMRMVSLLGGMMLLMSATAYGAGINAYSNKPGKTINSPNDAKAEARKSAELTQWRKLQDDFIKGKSTQDQYVAARQQLNGGQKGKPSSGPVTTAVAQSVWLNIPPEQQVCKEHCGPASTHEMLAFSGNSSLSQTQIAGLEGTAGGTGTCTPTNSSYGGDSGTCIAPIRDVLNNNYHGLPYANFYATYRLDHSSVANAYTDYSSLTDYELYNHDMPFLQLIDPKPCDGKTVLPGWSNTSSCGYRHYVITREYQGIYNGTRGSRTITVDDTAWWTVAAKTIDLQDIGYMVYEANGDGGCDSNLKNIVY
jgi:hypothetical protein